MVPDKGPAYNGCHQAVSPEGTGMSQVQGRQLQTRMGPLGGSGASRDGRPNSLGIGASRSFWLLPAELGQRGVIPRYSSVRRTSTVISMVKASSQANQSMQSTDRVAHRACFPQSNSLVKIPHSNDQRGAHPSAAAQLHPGISPRLG